MDVLACDVTEPAAPRGRLLRLIDHLAERQMQHSLDVIDRAQRASADIDSVTQPSSSIARSSTSPCDR